MHTEDITVKYMAHQKGTLSGVINHSLSALEYYWGKLKFNYMKLGIQLLPNISDTKF